MSAFKNVEPEWVLKPLKKAVLLNTNEMTADSTNKKRKRTCKYGSQFRFYALKIMSLSSSVYLLRKKLPCFHFHS